MIEIESSHLQNIFSQPFNPLITFNPEESNILFYTQSFAKLIGFNASTDAIPLSAVDRLPQPLDQTILLDHFAVFQWQNYDSNYRLLEKSWITECIHELRTSSMLIDLGFDILKRGRGRTNNDHIMPKVQHAVHRQKISTLIVSDLLQLLHAPLTIEPTSLGPIIRNSILSLREPHQVQINSSIIFSSVRVNSINPFIFVDQNFFQNFLMTVFLWLQNIPITLDIEILNPVSVALRINIPHDQLLSIISPFNLMMNYLSYVVAYFNGRMWCTQNVINMIFQMIK